MLSLYSDINISNREQTKKIKNIKTNISTINLEKKNQRKSSRVHFFVIHYLEGAPLFENKVKKRDSLANGNHSRDKQEKSLHRLRDLLKG